MEITKSYLTELVYMVNGAAIEVHKALGPGLLESVYHKCMVEELKHRHVTFYSVFSVPVEYKETIINTELRFDLLIEDILPVELKAIETFLSIHEAQILTYMKLLKVPEGLLINFNSTNVFKNGQRTFVNELYSQLKDH